MQHLAGALNNINHLATLCWPVPRLGIRKQETVRKGREEKYQSKKEENGCIGKWTSFASLLFNNLKKKGKTLNYLSVLRRIKSTADHL
jgi:hypothetical protein